MKILNCKTNHMHSPVGFAMDYAVVSWIAESNTSVRQEYAQIKVASDPNMQNIIYSSDPLASPDSTGFKLPLELKPRTSYYWTVQVWGDQGDTAVSSVNYFETGKREESLCGEWLTTPWEDKNINPYIRKNFQTHQKIKKARLYIAGLGLYLLEVNGHKVDNEFFAPGCNAYDQWVQIYTYDITDMLNCGDNTLGILMGKGWANGRFGVPIQMHTEPFLDEYLLNAELHLEYSDGTDQIIYTDNTWKCAPSPILEDGIYDGEVYDERRVISNWSCHDFSDNNWECMISASALNIGKPEDRLSLPVVVKELVTPVALLHTPAGELVLDMGQNMTGWVRMRVHEPAGTTVKLTHGEILQDDNFYRDNLRTARAEYIYISDGTEKFAEPHFTFYGFRYVKLEGFTQTPDLDDFTGCVVYSDLEESGCLTTSDTRINRLFANAKWSQKDNFLDVPTDCPQRDERMGWTGDAQAFCKTACYNMDTYAFYTKYLHDLWKEQKKNQGMVGHIVPSMLRETAVESSFWNGGSCVWGDAAVIIPWTLYTHYGDSTILQSQYESMKAWIDWISRTYIGPTGLWDQGFHFGDWLSLDAPPENGSYGGTDKVYIASSYFKYSSELVSKTAHILGLHEDESYYQKLSERTKTAIQKTYFTESGHCTIQTQTANVLALQMELAEPKFRHIIAADLIELLKEKDMHLQTGFVGTPFLCKVLSQEGYSKEAYELLFKDDFPSWLYEVDMGATTIWERWNSILPNGKISSTGMNSLNHYTYGSIAQWMYENIGGLTLKDIGFKSFYIKPEFTEHFDFVDMKYNSPKGMIEIRWEKENSDTYHLYVKVPFDTTAVLPSAADNMPQILTAGEYNFTIDISITIR